MKRAVNLKNLLYFLMRECHKGSFNNFVDQILPNFDPPTLLNEQKWTFFTPSTLCHMTHCGLYTDPPPHSSSQLTWLLNNPNLIQGHVLNFPVNTLYLQFAIYVFLECKEVEVAMCVLMLACSDEKVWLQFPF